MKKSLLSALGLAIALAFTMPVISASTANAASMHSSVKKHHRHHRHHHHTHHRHHKPMAKKY